MALRAAQFVCMRQDGRVTKASGEDSSTVVSLISHCKLPTTSEHQRKPAVIVETQRGQI